MKLRELFVELGIEAEQGEVDEFADALDNVRERMGDLVKGAAKVAAGIMGLVGAMGALSAKESLLAEEFIRTAQAFDISTDRYQRLRFEFQSLNASSDDLHDTFGKLNRRIQRASEGAQSYQRAFAQLNLSHEDFANIPMEDRLDVFFEGIEKTEDAGQALAAASRILGSDLARRLLPGIRETSGAMERYGNIAEEAGLIIEEDLLKPAMDAQFQFRALGAVISAATRRIGVQLAPAFGNLAESAMEGVAAIMLWVNQVGEAFSRELAMRFEKLKITFKTLNDFVQESLFGWKGIIASIAGGLTAVFAVMTGKTVLLALAAIKKFLIAIGIVSVAAFAKFLAIALAVAAAIALIVFVVEEMVGFFTEIDTWLGSAQDADAGGFDFLLDGVESLLEFIGKLAEGIRVIWDLMLIAFADLGGSILDLVNELMPVLMILLGAIGIVIMGIISGTIALLSLAAWIVARIVDFISIIMAIINIFLEIFMRVMAGVGGAILGIIGLIAEAVGWLLELLGLVDDVDADVSATVDKTEGDSRGDDRDDPGDSGQRGLARETARERQQGTGSTEHYEETNVSRGDTVYNVESTDPKKAREEIEEHEEEEWRRLESNHAVT